MDRKKVAAATLGCKVNMYDTEAMLGLFSKAGYEIVGFESFAHVYIVNTCTVTNIGDKKSRQLLRRARKLNPNAIVIAAGCYAQVAPEELKSVSGVDLIIGTKDRGRITEIVAQFENNRVPASYVGDIMKERDFEALNVDGLSERTRAYLKIQEGCDRFCSYCIIPYARGPIRSRMPADVIAEVKRLSAKGYKEVVLTGIHIASYGRDISGTSLLDILARVHEIEGIERIRFSSIEPTVVTDSFIDTIAKLPKICDHFHLSLQSGCDRVLKQMNRKYDTKAYGAAVHALRVIMPDVAVTTDIIVGFPGETERDFEESLKFAEEMALSKIHVFPYSPKAGTKAAGLPGQIPPKEKEERAKRMNALAGKLQQAYTGKFAGKTLSVLFERALADHVYEGHATNYTNVRVRSDKCIENEIFDVYISQIKGSIAFGQRADRKINLHS